MKYRICFFLFACSITVRSQKADSVIGAVQKRQKSLYAVSYTLQRSDTFVTGTTRQINGHAILRRLASDSTFGYSFWAKRDDIDQFTLYDGKLGYNVNSPIRV